ncbi:hypothetical protein [Comamonas sp. JC664]|uniref:hypothetical protein n=1 Tax=Comamonas sp. JC664 TaxID=2801917 RepID=UPI001E615322|nr:hypothetical protein [Comamonas sp. JC664]
MAICMLVIVPVFMYSLFLFDLLRHTLDAQETGLSTIWDYSVLDYAKKPESVPSEGGGTTTEAFAGFGMAQGTARQMFCDHESGLDSYDPGPERECGPNLEDHHTDVVASACWLNPGAQQVQCYLDANAVGAFGVSLHQSYMDTFQRGGLIRCDARLGVQNYLLPEEFLPEFSKVKMAKELQKGRVHTNAQAGRAEDNEHGASNVYLLPWERIALLTDTWALSASVSMRPGYRQEEASSNLQDQSEGLYARVVQLYQNQENMGFTQMSNASVSLVGRAISSNLLHTSLRLSPGRYDAPGDDPRQPSLAIMPQEGDSGAEEEIEQQRGRHRYFSNEWRDWGSNNNERSYQGRGNWYLGCAREESC